ncbi:MAG: hypothetical protein LC797_06485 [Chloroflexi bacterium]|nr:hypothetical protein [Chloroflexota bacterium]
MLHITAERLAALADDEPTALEAAHLDACPACCAERAAGGRLIELAAGERFRLAPPVTSWETLAPRLRDEKLLPPIPAATPTVKHFRVARLGLRAAAALLLVGGGVAVGRFSARPRDAGVAVPQLAVTQADDRTAPPSGAPVVAPASNAPAIAFKSTEEALLALAQAENLYQRASSYLVAHESPAQGAPEGAAAYRMRLAALDNVMAGAREALYEAPHDPLINRYYLATAGAREVTLQQLNMTLPVGARLTRY